MRQLLQFQNTLKLSLSELQPPQLLVFIRFQFYPPFVLTISFFFFIKFFLWLLFPLSGFIITEFLDLINLSFTWALSIQYTSYFLIRISCFTTGTMSQILDLEFQKFTSIFRSRQIACTMMNVYTLFTQGGYLVHEIMCI